MIRTSLFSLVCGALALSGCEQPYPASPSAQLMLGSHAQALLDDGCGDTSGVAPSSWPVAGGCPTRIGRSPVRGSREGTLRFRVGVGEDVRGDVVLGAGDVAYLATDDGRLWSVDTAGEVNWKTSACQWWQSCGAGGGAAVALDGTVYFGAPDDALQAISPAGESLWEVSLPGTAKASPAIGGDGTIYATYVADGLFSSTGGVVALAADGTQLWSYETSCGLLQDCGVETPVTLTAAGDLLFGDNQGEVHALAPDGTPRWTYATGGGVHSRISVDASTAYVGSNDNAVHAVELATGARRWRKFSLANVTGGVAVGRDGNVYFGSHDFRLHALDAATGATQWTFQTLGPIRGAPTVDGDGAIYFGSDDNHLYAVSPTGTKLWDYDVYGNIRTSPAISLSGSIYVGSDAHKLHAIGFAPEPHLYVDSPAFEDAPLVGTTRLAERDGEAGPLLAIEGRFVETTPGSTVEITFEGATLPVTREADGSFRAEATLATDGPGVYVDHAGSIVAVDGNGLSERVDFVVRVKLRDVIPGALKVRFHSYASALDIRDVLAPLGARVRRVDPRSKSYSLEVDPSEDTEALAASLTALTDVAYALAETPGSDDGQCDPDPAADDPAVGTVGFQFMQNAGDLIALDRGASRLACEVDSDCKNPQETCFVDLCTTGAETAVVGTSCTTRADCSAQVDGFTQCLHNLRCRSEGGWITATTCTTDQDCAVELDEPGATCVATGLCGHQGVADADIGWADVNDEICELEATGHPTTIGFIETQHMANLQHADLQARLWTNVDECGAPTCGSDAECVAALAAGSECRGTVCDGPDSDRLPDCVAGELGTPDGCPGRCGDDDGDGLADLQDPEVAALLDRLNGNCLDDDGDGVVDDGRPAVAALDAAETSCGDCTDDDGDGVVDDGCPAIASVGAPESDLVTWDDDENGYIDDMHGFDFLRAAAEGELAGATHVPTMRVPTQAGVHGTMVTSVMAELDNGYSTAGINPAARMMVLVSEGARYFGEAARYASENGANVVNMSWGTYCDCRAPCTGAARDAYENCIVGRTRMFNEAADPSIAYFISAGNRRRDLTAMAAPDAQGQCAGDASGLCKWRFPQAVGTYLNAAGEPFPEGTGPVNTAVIAATNRRDELADYWLGVYAGIDKAGTNIGGPNASGGGVVDFGAPSDGVAHLSNHSSVVWYRTTGATSFATPVVSSIASVLISRHPNEFLNRPVRLLERLRQTLEPCAAPGAGVRTCAQAMTTPGRVDLDSALDFDTFPMPAPSLFEDESFRLGNLGQGNTKDIELVDADGDGITDFLIEVFGGPITEQVQPRLYAFAVGGILTDVTYGDDQTPGGSGANADRLPSIPGNYNKLATADLDGDGCTDLVLGGYWSQDATPGAAEGDLAGSINRLLLQQASGGSCLGRFVEAADDVVGPGGEVRMPTREDITRGVDVFDFDLDGDLDIFFTNAVQSEPGGNLGNQLLVNQLVEEGIAYFVDRSDAVTSMNTGDPHRASVRRCDVNADGYPDLVVAFNTTTGGSNAIFENQDDGNGGREFVDVSVAAGLPDGTNFSHDVECHDFTGDGYPELLFARRRGLPNLFFVNDGDGTFTDASSQLAAYPNTTQEVEVCDLDGDGAAEVIFGNGDITAWAAHANQVFTWDASTGFTPAGNDFGFHFDDTIDLTEEIECADFNSDGIIDSVFVGNTGERNYLYGRQ